MRLDKKVAVVTGAGSGMGKEIARLFAQEGEMVIVSDININSAKDVARDIVSKGGEAIAVLTNVAKEEDIQNLIDTAVEKYGTIDILVNNAGIMDNFVPAGNLTDELWEKVFAVNSTGPMRAIRKVIPIFLEKGKGVIINLASIGGLCGSRAGAAYTASKHAVIGLTKNVGFQYANKGIRCNAIAQGGVKTNIGATITDPDEFGMERANVDAVIDPRFGDSEDIAKIALFLASDESSFVNGTLIIADGGWTVY